jgi:hypothetical protein
MVECKDKEIQMVECKECTCNDKSAMPTIIVNITYNDNRVHEDECNYVDNVDMREADSDE